MLIVGTFVLLHLCMGAVVGELSIPRSFFGIHVHNHKNSTIDLPWIYGINFTTIRLWDTGTIWAAIEPRKGEFDFKVMDAYVDLTEKRSLTAIYTMGVAALWAASDPSKPSPYGNQSSCSPPKDMRDWEEYVRAVGTRYKGKIFHWEIWNEPDIFWDPKFFCGSIQDLVDLTASAYRILKAIDPRNKIISPSITQVGPLYLFNYLRGAHAYIDIVGFHFYYQPYLQPSWALKVLLFFLRMMKEFFLVKGPLWYTEGGFSICKDSRVLKCTRVANNILPEEEQARLLIELLQYAYEGGAERWCIYAWNNREFTHLLADDEITLTVTGKAIQKIMRDS